jgi:hypothetical protein
MGNRAVITASKTRTKGVGIYLHWNGGEESVQAFLDVAKARGFRDPSSDESYGLARLCGLIHEFFGVDQDTSLGIGTLEQLDCDNYDNGVYVIGKDWQVVDRWGKGSRTFNIDQARAGEQYAGIVEQLTLKEKTT